jgi:hypothetical protein
VAIRYVWQRRLTATGANGPENNYFSAWETHRWDAPRPVQAQSDKNKKKNRWRAHQRISECDNNENKMREIAKIAANLAENNSEKQFWMVISEREMAPALARVVQKSRRHTCRRPGGCAVWDGQQLGKLEYLQGARNSKIRFLGTNLALFTRFGG